MCIVYVRTTSCGAFISKDVWRRCLCDRTTGATNRCDGTRQRPDDLAAGVCCGDDTLRRSYACTWAKRARRPLRRRPSRVWCTRGPRLGDATDGGGLRTRTRRTGACTRRRGHGRRPRSPSAGRRGHRDHRRLTRPPRGVCSRAAAITAARLRTRTRPTVSCSRSATTASAVARRCSDCVWARLWAPRSADAAGFCTDRRARA